VAAQAYRYADAMLDVRDEVSNNKENNKWVTIQTSQEQ
jgi:hypothetical protein